RTLCRPFVHYDDPVHLEEARYGEGNLAMKLAIAVKDSLPRTSTLTACVLQWASIHRSGPLQQETPLLQRNMLAVSQPEHGPRSRHGTRSPERL
ncbi:hypothetical protein HAX54_007274, partial [Datura stramonium]|nr:hypothetical protein [Datura stramonium]